MLDKWRIDWHLAGSLRTLGERGSIEVRVGELEVSVRDEDGRLVARSAGREHPVMVVDDEIFVLLSDAPR
ncbi:MAG: hypothetical protein R3286_03995 [Gammaproteobacteria bacterium]|nr:hypothetical protein [Gammaproteobacteria bacterium]